MNRTQHSYTHSWAARSALQRVTGRIVIPDIFVPSENNTSSKWLIVPAVADVALSGPRHNLTLRHAAQCTGAASSRAAHQSTAQRAALTDETLRATERNNLSVELWHYKRVAMILHNLLAPSYLWTSGVPRNFFGGGGSTNSVEDRDSGGLGAVAP